MVPTKFVLQFGTVNSITQVVAGTVFYEGYQFFVRSFRTVQFFIHDTAKQAYYINVGPLIMATNIVGASVFCFMKYHINRTGMVFYKKPVAHVLSLAVNRQRFIVFNIMDAKR